MTHLYPPGKITLLTKAPGIFLSAFFTLLASHPQAFSQEDSARFHARFADGTAVNSETIHAWHDANATPRLGPHPLFDNQNPVQWLIRDRFGPIPEPNAFVEFLGGDRLPGVVVGSAASPGETLHDLPRHLIVEPIGTFRRPNMENAPPLRIELAHVRRIVWQAGTEPAPTSTAVQRDGSRITFRALRWSDESAALLTESDIVTIPFDDLAEIALPLGDPWEAYFDHAAALLPDGQGQLVQLETESGLVALTSAERLRPETYGDNRYPEHWFQIIQPAWSLDPLWVRFPDIHTWRVFPPHRVPLTLISPRIVREAPILSGAISPTTNRTRAGSQLSDGTSPYGWAFATHAPCELIFPVPAQAIALQSEFGLDPMVKAGGSALARIELRKNEKSAVLFESEALIGAGPAQSLGRLPISEAARADGTTLHLISDPLLEQRPQGADPFDIRDTLNWYAPTLELESQAVREMLRARALQRIPALAQWEFIGDSATYARVETRWSTRDWDDPRFQSSVAVEKGYFGVRRKMPLPADARYLAVLAYSPQADSSAEDVSPSRIQARIDGKPIAELPVPITTGRREPDPLLFPIEEFAGRTVVLELFQLPEDKSAKNDSAAPVDWVGIAAVPRRPGLRDLLSDPPPELAELSQDSIFAIPPPGFGAGRLPGWNFVISEEPNLGEYRYAQWTWSAPGAGPIALSLAHGGELGTDREIYVPPPRIRRQPSRGDDRGPRNGYRYIAGSPDPNHAEFSPAIALDADPPHQMRRVQRDLYNDFGPFILTGFALSVEDAPLMFGGLWLARSPDQFRYIESEQSGPPRPNPGKPPVLFETRNPPAFAPLLEKAAPGFTFWSGAANLALLESHADRANVLRTSLSKHEDSTAGRFTSIMEIPSAGISRLRGAVWGDATLKEPAVLSVTVNGRTLHEVTLSSDTWTEIDINLDKYAGKTIRLELQVNAPNESKAEFHWHDIRIEHGPGQSP